MNRMWITTTSSRLALAALGFGALTASSSDAEANKPADPAALIDAQLKEDLTTLGSAKIFFGHHSVGDDLLAGIKALSSAANIPVTIQEVRPGKNGDPKAKVEDWLKQAQALPEGSEVAMMKFCYADFMPNTDVDAVFKAYTEAVDTLKKARPDLSLLHITTPLTVNHVDFMTKVKRMLGREIWEDAAGLKRQQYNDLLRDRFAGKEPFFDLAAWESKGSGAPSTIEIGGKKVEILPALYARDKGGHLNEHGQQAGGKELARALATLVKDHKARAAAAAAKAAEEAAAAKAAEEAAAAAAAEAEKAAKKKKK
ncbi:hypothetical protein L6R52_14235 [Myxococcota bacterium]|nr:hypothetical protein [Myxococcota bacterium]